MRPSIKRLNPQLIDAVRAGTAVSTSNYSGAVCELIANALDAGSGNSSSIEVCLDVPRGYIRVEDTGVGMCQEDMAKVGQRYCTSKLSGLQDIRNGTPTLGYRGEALASLSTMCLQLRIASRVCGSFETLVKTFQGQSSNLGPSGPGEMQVQSGTTVTCSGFMHNQPVRLKQTLDRHQEMLEQAVWAAFRLVLPFPHVALLVKEPSGKVLLQLEKGRSLVSCLPLLFPSCGASPTVAALAGGDASSDSVAAPGSWGLVGYVSKEPMLTKDRQLLYVNRRLVSSAFVTDFVAAWLAQQQQLRQHDRDDFGRDPDKNRLHPGFLLLLTCPGQAVEFSPEPDKTVVTFRGQDTVRSLLQAMCVQSSKDFKSKLPPGAASVPNPVPGGAVPATGLGNEAAARGVGSLRNPSLERELPAAKGRPLLHTPAEAVKAKPNSSRQPALARTIIGKFLGSVTSRRGEASRAGHRLHASHAAPAQPQPQLKDAALRQSVPRCSAQRPGISPDVADLVDEDSCADYDKLHAGSSSEDEAPSHRFHQESEAGGQIPPEDSGICGWDHRPHCHYDHLCPGPSGHRVLEEDQLDQLLQQEDLDGAELLQDQRARRSYQGHVEGRDDFLAAMLDDLDAGSSEQQGRRSSQQFLADISQARDAGELRMQDDDQLLSPARFCSEALEQDEFPSSSGIHLFTSPASPERMHGANASPLVQTMLQFGPDLEPIQVHTQRSPSPSPCAFSPTAAYADLVGERAQGQGCVLSPMQLMDTSPQLSQQTTSLDSDPAPRPKRTADHRTPAPAGFSKSRKQPACGAVPGLDQRRVDSLVLGSDLPCELNMLQAAAASGEDMLSALASPCASSSETMPCPSSSSSPAAAAAHFRDDGGSEECAALQAPAAAAAAAAAAGTVCRRLQYDDHDLHEPAGHAFSPDVCAAPPAARGRSPGGRGEGSAPDEHPACQSPGIQPQQRPQPGRSGWGGAAAEQSVPAARAMQPLHMPSSAEAARSSCSLESTSSKPASQTRGAAQAVWSSPSQPSAAARFRATEGVQDAALPAASPAVLLDNAQDLGLCSRGEQRGSAASMDHAAALRDQQAPEATSPAQQEHPVLKVKKQVHFSSPLAVSAGLPCSRWSPRVRVASACAAKQQHPAPSQEPGAAGCGSRTSVGGRPCFQARGAAAHSPGSASAGDVQHAEQGSLEGDSDASSAAASGDTECTSAAALYASATESFTPQAPGCSAESAEHPGSDSAQLEALEAGGARDAGEDPVAAAAAAGAREAEAASSVPLASLPPGTRASRKELRARLGQLLSARPSSGLPAESKPLLRPALGAELSMLLPLRIPSAGAAAQEVQEPGAEPGPGPVLQTQLQRLLSGGWQNPIKAQRAQLQATQVVTLEELGQRRGPGRLGSHHAQLVPTEVTKLMLDAAVVLDQVDHKFIAMACSDTLVITDQHAADERVRLESFEAAVLAARPSSAGGGSSLPGSMQEQLTWADPAALSSVILERPQAVQLTRPEIASWHAHKAAAQTWGWLMLEPAEPDEGAAAPVQAGSASACEAGFGTHAQLLVTRVPCVLGVALNATDLRVFLLQLSESNGSDDVPEAVQRLLKSKACRSAIMFGDPLTSSSCQDLVRSLRSAKLWSSCAHGRPTMVPILNLSVLKQIAGYEI